MNGLNRRGESPLPRVIKSVRRLIVHTAMHPVRIIEGDPPVQFLVGVGQGRKDLVPQAFCLQHAMPRFDVGVLVRGGIEIRSW